MGLTCGFAPPTTTSTHIHTQGWFPANHGTIQQPSHSHGDISLHTPLTSTATTAIDCPPLSPTPVAEDDGAAAFVLLNEASARMSVDLGGLSQLMEWTILVVIDLTICVRMNVYRAALPAGQAPVDAQPRPAAARGRGAGRQRRRRPCFLLQYRTHPAFHRGRGSNGGGGAGDVGGRPGHAGAGGGRLPEEAHHDALLLFGGCVVVFYVVYVYTWLDPSMSESRFSDHPPPPITTNHHHQA